jgi:hypothetical protein
MRFGDGIYRKQARCMRGITHFVFIFALIFVAGMKRAQCALLIVLPIENRDELLFSYFV